ncbi:DUF4403 family protein [Lunatimonas salinarum]|uniref:DUF4403 family protein n=1 Tax=Lunatimonas salinarum TaxID=1774590 RepID=UPI001AE006C5|nr:DUF4403 family protein [Lunatimonas salinarum]
MIFRRVTTPIFPVFLLVVLLGCRKIDPAKPTYVGERQPLPKAVSEINLRLALPLSLFESKLNEQLAENLFSEKGIDLGNGLFSDVTVVKTGLLRLAATESGKLRVTLPVFLDGKVSLEKRIFGQVVSAGVPFKESLTPQVSFRPHLDENWEVEINELEVESWGRSLRYDLLGYSLDLEPIMKQQLENMLERKLASNLLASLDLRRIATQAWEAYSEPISLRSEGIELFLTAVPERVMIREQFTEDQQLLLHLGIDGEVFSQMNPPAARPKSPLPRVYPNDREESRAVITLPLALSYAWMDQYLQEEMVGNVFRVDNRTTLVPHSFATQAYGDRALVRMEFTAKRIRKKDVKGELYLVGMPVYDEEKQAVVFEEVDFDLKTQHFLTNSANWLKGGKIRSAIEKQAVFPIGDYLAEARRELRELGSWQTAFADFSLVSPELEVQGIYVTEEGIQVYVRSMGDIAVRMK